MKHQLLLAGCFALITSLNHSFGQESQSGSKKHGKSKKTSSVSVHQEQCAARQRHEYLMKNDPAYVTNRESAKNNYQQYLKNPVSAKAVVTIPVVVHVIHTGQAVGVGINISDAQIQSAIDNMNDAYSNSSNAFTTYTGVNTNIQFCLAQRDASGNPSTGIVRVNGSGVSNYSTKGICSSSGGTGIDNEQAVKALSKWDKTQYYNFWIVNEIDDNGGGAGTQGYAYPPGAGAAVDGSVMLYNAFGYDPDASLGYNLKSYTNRNTTAVHEMGHALDLDHTFQGDGTGSTCPTDAVCGTSGDCVADTPRHKRSTSSCVADGTVNTCQAGTTAGDYQHNFMDYSSDVCQTEFTAGQSTRMDASLSDFSAAGRGTLTTSDGCTPANNALDASITTIISPISSFCQTTFSPIVTLRNFGTTTLISATITYNIDGGSNQVYNWSGSLISSASENVTLDPISTTTGSHIINVTVSAPNGGSDAFTTNDLSSTTFTITTSSTLPFTEDFEGAFPPASWTRTSGDIADASAWDVDGVKQLEKRAVTVESDGTAGNALAINGYGYSTSSGDRTDQMVSPSIDLVSASAPSLKFQVSHKYYNTTSNTEALRVYISTDCGVTYTEIYNKSSSVLATNGQGTTPWAPTNITHWREETLDLTSYAGNVITLKFETESNYGNNLYIDKINLFDNCSSPVVSSQPSNSTNCAATNASFTVSNTGGGSYVWQENNGGGFTNISDGGIYSNATTATLSLTGVTVGMNAYTYRCVITNGCGSVNSNTVTLTVNSVSTPTISAGGATTFCAGGSVTLTSSAASGNTWSTGATTQAITVSSAGTYTVTATASGCSATSAGTTVTVNSSPATPTISAGGATTFCTGGSVTLTSSSASGNTWSTGATTQSISVNATGSYTVTVTASGCSSTSAATAVTVNSIPTITIGATSNPTTCGGSDGSINILGAGTGTLAWTGTASASVAATLPFVVNSLAAGTYNFTFTISGCTSPTVSQSISDPSGPATPTISAGGATTFCNGGSVTLTSSSASGNTWSTGATTQSISVSSSGTYSVTVTASGCSATSAGTTVTVNALPTITQGTVSNPSACAGADGSIQVTGSGTGNLTWTGTASGSMMGTTLPATVGSLTAGTYDFSFDDGCVSNTLSISLNDPGAPATPTISASGSTSFCTGGSVTLTSSSASGNTWSTGATTQSITVSTAGSYSVTLTVAGCSSTSAATTVTVNSIPTITIGATANPTTCGGSDGSINILGAGTGTLAWTGTASLSVPGITLPFVANSLAAGTYNFTFTVSGCTSPTVSQSISDPSGPATPTISAGGATTFCTGGSVTLTSSSASGNSWSTGATTQSITVSTAGSYTVTVTASGCSATSAGTTVTVNALPTIAQGTVSNPSVCGGSDGSIQVTGSGTGNLSWTGTASGSMMATTLPATVGSLAAGTYDFTFDDGCVSNILSVSLSDPGAPATPTISASGATTFCTGGSVTLTSSSASGNTWSTGATTQSISVSTAGSYSVTLTVAGCSSTSVATTVTVNSIPTITIGATANPTTCGGSDGSINILGAGTGTLAWTGTASLSVPGITLPFVANSLAAGTYNFTFTVSGCTSPTISQSLSDPGAPATPTITASGATTFCAGGTVTLTSSSASDNVWSTGETTTSIVVAASGTYTLSLNVAGCVSAAANITVTVNPLPSAPTVSSNDADNIVCSGDLLTLTSSQATGNTWSTTETTQSINVSATGTYTVTVTDGTCTNSASTSVTVNPTPSIALGTIVNPSSCGVADGSIQITGSGTGVLSWVGSDAGSSGTITLPFVVSGLKGVSYDFSLVSSDACLSNTTSTTLADQGTLPTPVITASGSTTICSGTSVTLTSSETSGNVWSTGETTQSISVNTAGTYTLNIVIGSCTPTSATQAVTVIVAPATPSISISGATTFCAGDSVILTSSELTGNTWSTGETSQSITVLASGNYTVIFSDGTCSSASSAVESVTVNPIPAVPTISASGSLVQCEGETIDLTSSATTGISWTPNGETSATISVGIADDYSVTVTENGCSSTSAVTTLTINANPIVNITPYDSICNTSATFTLDHGSPVGGTYTVNGTAATDFDPATAIIGLNTIVYTFVDGSGCSAKDTTLLEVDDCSGLDENKTASFVLYPNPTSSTVQLKGDLVNKIGTIELRDALGRKIADFNIAASDKTIDLSPYANGLYNLVILVDSVEYVQAVQIMK